MVVSNNPLIHCFITVQADDDGGYQDPSDDSGSYEDDGSTY